MALKSKIYPILIGFSKPRSVYIIAGGLRAILDELEGIIEWFVRKRFLTIAENYIPTYKLYINSKTFLRDWEDLLFPWIPFITRYTLGYVRSIFQIIDNTASSEPTASFTGS